MFHFCDDDDDVVVVTVPDLDFEMGGERSSRHLDKGRGWSPKTFFSPLRTSVWSKNRGGAGPSGPLPWIRPCVNSESYLVDIIVTPLD